MVVLLVLLVAQVILVFSLDGPNERERGTETEQERWRRKVR